MTHLLSSSRMTSDTLRPSASALDCAAAHSSSSMRTLRNVVPRGTLLRPIERLDALPAQVRDRRQARVSVRVVELLDVAVGAPDGGCGFCVAHVNKCTYTCTYTQGAIT